MERDQGGRKIRGEELFNILGRTPSAWRKKARAKSGQNCHAFYTVWISSLRMLKLGKTLNWKERLDQYLRIYRGDVVVVYLRKFERRRVNQTDPETATYYVSKFEDRVIAHVKTAKINIKEPVNSHEYVDESHHKELLEAIEKAVEEGVPEHVRRVQPVRALPIAPVRVAPVAVAPRRGRSRIGNPLIGAALPGRGPQIKLRL